MKKKYIVISFYCFTPIDKDNFNEIRDKLLDFEDSNLTGLIILGEEGINGTVCAPNLIMNTFIKLVRKVVSSQDLNIKESCSIEKIFKKLKIKIKPEIARDFSLMIQSCGS